MQFLSFVENGHETVDLIAGEALNTW